MHCPCCCLYLSTRWTSSGTKHRRNTFSLVSLYGVTVPRSFTFASSKYFARRRLGIPTSSVAENETTGFTVSLIFQTGKLEQNIQASKAICTQSSFSVLELRRQVTERRVWITVLPPSPYATHTSSSGKIKVNWKIFCYLFIGEKFLQEHQPGRHIFKQQLPLTPKQKPFFKGFQIMTLRTCL